MERNAEASSKKSGSKNPFMKIFRGSGSSKSKKAFDRLLNLHLSSLVCSFNLHANSTILCRRKGLGIK